MNLRATIVLSALIILLLGCKDNKETVSSNTPVGTVLAEPEKEYLQEKKYTLLLIDKTISSETGALDEKYEEKVAELVKTNFNFYGAVFQGSFIHGNTLGVPPFVVEVFGLKPEEGLEEMPKIKRVQAENKYEAQVKNRQDSLLATLKDNLLLTPGESTKKHTDLWGAFELMSTFFQKNKDGSTKEAVFISDMMESMPGKGRHDFHKKLPKNKQEAEQLARKDTRWILANFSINKQALKGVQVKVWPPIDPLQTSEFRFLRYYWDTLFNEFGVEVTFY